MVSLFNNKGQARELLSVPPEQRLAVLRLAAAKGRPGTLSGRLIREAKAELLGERPSNPLGKKVSLRFFAEMSSFMAWLARLKAAVKEGRRDEVLLMIDEVERTQQINGLPEKVRRRGRRRSTRTF